MQSPDRFDAQVPLRSWFGLLPVPFALVATLMAAGLLLPAPQPVAVHVAAALFAAFGWAFTALHLYGRIAVRRDADRGSVFIGAGSLGWTREFDWRSIESAGEAPARGGFTLEIQPGTVIELRRRAGAPIRFGSTLSASKRARLLDAIRRELAR